MLRNRLTTSLLAGTVGCQARCSAHAKRDPYEVLGVSRTASEAEVKKAYRKKALESHPDTGGCKDKFAEIGEAYDVLSKPEKRQMFDAHGHQGVESMGGPAGGGPGFGGRQAEDIFKEFFGGFDFHGGGGRGRQKQVRDIDVKVSLTLEEVYSGVTKQIRVTRPAICADCRGEGAKSGAKTKCSQCQGSGQEIIQHRMGPGMVQQVVTACRKCKGQGSSVKPEDVCKKCSGEGYTEKTETLSVSIPPGVPADAALCLQGEGGEMPGAVAGNVNVHVHQVAHKCFARRSDDLIVHVEVSLSEALIGFEHRLVMLDGRSITVQTKPGEVLQHNGVLKLQGEGMKAHARAPGMAPSGRRGDVYVVVKVAMPKTVTEEQRQAIAAAFGAPKRSEAPAASVVRASVMKESWEQLSQRKAAEWGAGEQHGDDEGDGGGQQRRGKSRGGAGGRGPGGQQVECAPQ